VERLAEGACFWTKKRNADGWHGEWENGVALKFADINSSERKHTRPRRTQRSHTSKLTFDHSAGVL
jgi:hypothetical protein